MMSKLMSAEMKTKENIKLMNEIFWLNWKVPRIELQDERVNGWM